MGTDRNKLRQAVIQLGKAFIVRCGVPKAHQSAEWGEGPEFWSLRALKSRGGGSKKQREPTVKRGDAGGAKVRHQCRTMDAPMV